MRTKTSADDGSHSICFQPFITKLFQKCNAISEVGVGAEASGLTTSLGHVAAHELEATKERSDYAAADAEHEGGGEAAVEEEVHGE